MAVIQRPLDYGPNPTSFFFGALLFAFLFYITTTGDLAKWLGLLGLGGKAATSPAALPAAQNPQGFPSLAIPAAPGIGIGAGGMT